MIDIKRLKRQNFRFKLMLIISYILFTCIIFLTTYFIYDYILSNQNIQNFKNDAVSEGKIESAFLQNIYIQGHDTLLALSENEDFQDFLNTKHFKVKSVFLTLMNEHKNLMQLRYLDEDGLEIIRYERDFRASKPYESEVMQDKSQRSYFKEVKKTLKVYFSSPDLNIEYGIIQKPLKQVIRVSIPIFKDKKFKGALVANIFICSFLEHLDLKSEFDTYLVDKDGFFITSSDKKLKWTRFFGKENISSLLDIPKSELNLKAHFFNKNLAYIQPLHVDMKNSPYLIYFQSKSRQLQVQKDILKSGIYAFLVVFILSFPFSYIIALPISSVFRFLQKNSEHITLTANNLEKKIAKEIEKSRQKDKLLENNAKLVALGEMIANIAHQWRHPLTRLSLIIQNLSCLDLKDEKNQAIYKRYIKNSLNQISFMSETIEDFRNFYKNDSQKCFFEPSEAVKDAMKIIGGVIKHEGIKMNISVETTCKIYGYKNRFAQVILNLLHNSKEALKDEDDEHIRVYITSDESSCKVSVVDNGCGIKKENIDKMFDSEFSTKKDGSGIGLYLSKLIIEENFHGKIEAKRLDKGTQMTIIVPLKS